jgi:hypothetical protein
VIGARSERRERPTQYVGRGHFWLATQSQSARLQASADVSFGDTRRRRQFFRQRCHSQGV